MDDLNLLENHTYLLRYGCSDTVHSVTILMVTDKAYKIQWNGGGISWELKRRIYSDYTLVEDISDYLAPKPEDFKFEITYKDVDVKCHPYFLQTENCKVCGGTGQVPNFESTAGTKMCPACNGSCKESKRIDILFE
jgi:hypothetical protein